MFKPNTTATPDEYIAAIDEPRRSDIAKLDQLIRSVAPDLERYVAVGMLAYGHYHYRSKSGREGDWFPIGLASNKRYISLYVTATDPDSHYLAEGYKAELPKADIGRSCVRFKRLEDVDIDVLAELRAGAKYDGSALAT